MILHLTLGATHIPLEVTLLNDGEPHLSVLPEGVIATPSPPARSRRSVPRLVTMACVGAICGMAGYRFAGVRSDVGMTALTAAQAEPGKLALPEPDASPQMPAQLRRELGTPPVITRPQFSRGDAGPRNANSFGLE